MKVLVVAGFLGSGKTSFIKEKIKEVEYERIEMLEPISIIDAKNYFLQKEKYLDILLDQSKNSKFIQLTKIDGLDREELLKIKEDLLSINKDLIININDYKKEEISYFNNIFSNMLNREDIIKSDKLLNVKSKTIKNVKMKAINDFIIFCEKIIRSYYGNIYRAKGIVKIDNYNLMFDIVNLNYEFRITKDNSDNNIVLIGENIDIDLIEKENGIILENL